MYASKAVWGYLELQRSSNMVSEVFQWQVTEESQKVLKPWWWFCASKCLEETGLWLLFSKAKGSGFCPLPLRGERISLSYSGIKKAKTNQKQWGKKKCNFRQGIFFLNKLIYTFGFPFPLYTRTVKGFAFSPRCVSGKQYSFPIHPVKFWPLCYLSCFLNYTSIHF